MGTEEQPPEKPTEPKPLPSEQKQKLNVAVKSALPRPQSWPPPRSAVNRVNSGAGRDSADGICRTGTHTGNQRLSRSELGMRRQSACGGTSCALLPAGRCSYRIFRAGPVRISLAGGIPGDSRVSVPCGIGMIDRVALQAVQNAHYPERPADMRGRDSLYQVWLEFTR